MNTTFTMEKGIWYNLHVWNKGIEDFLLNSERYVRLQTSSSLVHLTRPHVQVL